MSKTINPKIKWREWAPNFYPVKRLFTSDRKRLIKNSKRDYENKIRQRWATVALETTLFEYLSFRSTVFKSYDSYGMSHMV